MIAASDQSNSEKYLRLAAETYMISSSFLGLDVCARSEGRRRSNIY